MAAIDIIDGFDFYQAAQATVGIWTDTGGSSNTSFGSTAGRFGGFCMSQGANNSSRGAQRPLSANTTSFCHSFAYYVASTPADTRTIFAYQDGTTTQVEIRIDSSRKIIVARNGTQLGITASAVVTAATWCWIEFVCKIDDTTGTYEVFVDGTSVLSGTGADTKNTANAYVNNLVFVSGGVANIEHRVDDMVFQNDSGGAPTTIGEHRVITLLPNAAGNYSEWTRSTGANNSVTVDENPPNSDTDYNASSTVNHRDTYNFASFGVTGVIKAVQHSLFARKDDAGTRKIKTMVRQNSADYLGTEFTMQSSYRMFQDKYLTDPDTSAAWTTSGIDAAEFGAKVTA